MTRGALQEYAAAVRPRYWTARKGEKGRILDEFCETTGLHRKAAIRMLRRQPRGPSLVRGRPRRYGPEVAAALVQIWEAGDRMCGKLLAAAMPDLLPALERHGELQVSADVRRLLLMASAASIDRLLRRHRTHGYRQPARQTPAAATLRERVPVRTWSEWQGVTMGSVQADLVLHCGERSEGFYLTTLCVVDVATGWTALQPVWGMGKDRVGAAMEMVRRRLPFPLRELHTDNGGEFINHLLVPWCERRAIRLSRGRSYRKNDQAYVEQRNWLSIRRQVGYERYSSHPAHALLQQLYPLLELQLNLFRPLRKVIAKERVGGRIRKHHDRPRTPYQRLLASDALDGAARERLQRLLLATNPAELRRRIEALLRQLWQQRDGWPQAGVSQELG